MTHIPLSSSTGGVNI